jgi:hypothetical protein
MSSFDGWVGGSNFLFLLLLKLEQPRYQTAGLQNPSFALDKWFFKKSRIKTHL